MVYPAATADLIAKINHAIQRLHDQRLGNYEIVSKKYQEIRAMYFLSTGRTEHDVPPLGFEAFISADMRRELEIDFDPSDVFMEFPGIGKEKIDIYVETNDAHAYIENKMYYSPGTDGPENPYRHDFDKVRALIDLNASMKPAVRFLVHFQLYENRAYPAHGLYETFASELAPEKWWSEIKCTATRDKKHFVRLAFGKKD